MSVEKIFDKTKFQIRSFDILPSIRDFFKQPTSERDLSHVDEIRRYLSDIKPFSRLPKSLQKQFLQEAWYECYPENRTIIRQDQRPACFYILLSGSAIINYQRYTDAHVQTLDILDRGCTFGEKGLMSDSTQKFSVISKTQVELLVLWKDDFRAIYMSDDRYCSKDDVKFLKTNVPFLRGFPVDRLNEFPHAIQHCNYGQSEVIARDTRRMKHIIVVKKGSMMIWKRLDPDGQTPLLNKHDFDQMDDEKMLDENESEATQDNSALFSEIQLSGDVEATTGGAATNPDRDVRFRRLRRSTTIDRRTSSVLSRMNSVVEVEKKFPGLADKRDRLELIDYDQLTINDDDGEPKQALRTRSMENSKPKIILPDRMIYVHIKTLNEGQYFGLTDMLFSNQPALTLISNECECLLLRKSSFVRIASDQYKQNIRRTEIPYPPDAMFYKSYHTQEVWKRYSKEVYRYAWDRMQLQHPRTIKR